jgi:hypothetical protein
MEEVELADVHDEFAALLKQHKITTYMRFASACAMPSALAGVSGDCPNAPLAVASKPVVRKYAFEKVDVPTEATILKYKYSAGDFPLGLPVAFGRATRPSPFTGWEWRCQLSHRCPAIRRVARLATSSAPISAPWSGS